MKRKREVYITGLPPIGEVSEILYLYFGEKLVATCAVRSDGKLIFSGNKGFEVKRRTVTGEYESIERRQI